MITWRFPSNDHGENKGINDSGVATFRGTPLKSLAREICQNSLDAASGKTVMIEFDMFSIPTQNIPGMELLKDAFSRCLEFWGMQKAITTKEFFTRAIDVASRDTCAVLRVSDFNTIGLTGVTEEINTNWINLTKSSGASDKKGTAGGSYGIGKYAPFACSDFSTVFYSTYNKDDEVAYQGVSRLVTFRRDDGETTQGVGYFGNDKNTPVLEQLSLDSKFIRKTGEYGTDIYIAGYKYADGDWQKDIIISVLDGFLGAIWNEKLELIVGDKTISKKTLPDLIEIYRDDLTDYTEQYYSVLISPETCWIEQDFMGLGTVKLGILVGDPEAPRRVAMIRKTGMKIMDKSHLPGHVPCVGIMFIEGDKLNERLRLMENPEHTLWQPDRAKNPNVAKELLRAINKFVKDEIEKIISVGGGDEIDAVGVGNYLPDLSEDKDEQSKDEVISDRVIEIESRKVPNRRVGGKKSGNDISDGMEEGGHKKNPGGDEEEWFHNDGHTDHPKSKTPQPAHSEDDREDANIMKTKISLKKFVPVCIEKSKGQYMLMIVPEEDADNGTIELYLSAETRPYDVVIKNASIIGGGNIKYRGNTISGIHFSNDKTIRLRIEIDYYEICAMEVKAYATAK